MTQQISDINRQNESVYDLVGQSLVLLGRILSKQLLHNQLLEQEDLRLGLSYILVAEAVAFGPTESRQEVRVGIVAERLAIHPSVASRLTVEAIKAGYLVRVSSKMNKRFVCLELTDAGRQLVDSANSYMRQVFEQLTLDWKDQERLEFAKLLIRFVSQIAPIGMERSDR